MIMLFMQIYVFYYTTLNTYTHYTKYIKYNVNGRVSRMLTCFDSKAQIRITIKLCTDKHLYLIQQLLKVVNTNSIYIILRHTLELNLLTRKQSDDKLTF